ncbi:isopenicillin-N N-acyltransferase-like protein [Paenarthrobacter nicotinovorans]|uniref:C45 family autoproteolytic acyltransferase/hydolase n=1 Tax=Micrococcaceae TaxID=1268 RepID=UPI0004ACF0CC|nr:MULTISPECIES: C45 family peptidase [Micrococcaceae]MDR6436704.1 isopenicillin-N N-acyltransferase-like protein [Paenarthrobacter nicotinovorans]SCZ56856.1 isopenicillin-N N-acyltransferase like protein [Arthrobacter sp. UNCCL28]
MQSITNTPALVAVQGSYLDMGEQLGQQSANLIEQSLNTYVQRFKDDAGLTDNDIDRWGERYWQILRSYNTDIAAMLEGMAKGSRQRVGRLAALNARTEILYGSGYTEEGCTSVSVVSTHTANGHTLIGQNWDWHPEQGPATFLLATRDTNGFSVLSLTEAGMLAKSGLNSAGLGVCANLLVSDRDAGGHGVPYHYLLRGVLQARTMSKAHKAVLGVSRVSSGNILLADADGESIDFELAPDDFGYLLPADGMIVHANHFESGLNLKDLKAGTSALTLLRSSRLRRLLEGKAQDRAVEVSDLISALRDTYSYPDGICRYPDPGVPGNEQVSTVYSVVMDLNTLDLWIAPGSPSENPYSRWNLHSLFTPGQQPNLEFHPLEAAHVH